MTTAIVGFTVLLLVGKFIAVGWYLVTHRGDA